MKQVSYIFHLSGLILLALLTMIPAATAQTPPACVPPPSGLVSWWPGNRDARDRVGSNEGTLRNGAAIAPGKVNQAFSFDGVDDSILVAHSPSLDLNEHTIGAWINPGAQQGAFYHGIVVKQNSDNSGRNYYVGLRNDGRIHYSIAFPSGFSSIDSNATVPAGAWTYVAATFGGGVMSVFINGQLDASLNVGNQVPGKTAQPLLIGHTNEDAPTFFKGLVDEVELYGRALSASEILSIFRADTAGKCRAIRGLDILSLARQDVDMIARELEPGMAIGVLQGTFGNDAPDALRKLLETGKVPAFRAHLLNGSCWRKGVCERGEPRLTDFEELRKRAELYQKLAADFPRVRCYLSPVLEHDEKNKAIVERWVSVLKASAPRCEVVISAESGHVPAGVLVERHGNDARGDIISNDGDSLFDSNSTRYLQGGETLVFGWIPRFNRNLKPTCRRPPCDPFVPPSGRKHKASRDDIRQVQALLRPEPPKPATAPRGCERAAEITAPEIFKTNAEEQENGDPRGNRSLYLSKIQAPRWTILSPDGRQIGCAAHYDGKYNNLHRHYVGSCSGDSPISLMEKAKSEWIYLKAGDRCVLANAIRRKGSYR